ncbi:hypothetical protein F503_02154 [Ophiostoma piceae UAMH 11346]|uniref:Uncharacterized protein n=1 Tax=Ophiostoma piceae (strain UAMH 11346) TaxID=1262450 RepID=S3CX49_OPHP1|nr:hypothetical protein F503_02154 [Ophiostoma piceae UAMH 11346]
MARAKQPTEEVSPEQPQQPQRAQRRKKPQKAQRQKKPQKAQKHTTQKLDAAHTLLDIYYQLCSQAAPAQPAKEHTAQQQDQAHDPKYAPGCAPFPRLEYDYEAHLNPHDRPYGTRSYVHSERTMLRGEQMEEVDRAPTSMAGKHEDNAGLPQWAIKDREAEQRLLAKHRQEQDDFFNATEIEDDCGSSSDEPREHSSTGDNDKAAAFVERDRENENPTSTRNAAPSPQSTD